MDNIEYQNKLKVTKDLFVWKIITDRVREIFSSKVFEVYVLFEDETESLITNFRELEHYLEQGSDFGIEVGYLDLKEVLKNSGKVGVSWDRADILNVARDLHVTLTELEIDLVIYNLVDNHDVEIGLNIDSIKFEILTVRNGNGALV